jgi:hypothetical protein
MSGISLVLDCGNPQALAPFWAAALRYQQTKADGQYVLLTGAPDGIPDLVLQGVPEPKAAKNRMHLDVEARDIEPEATRLEQLGARRLEPGPRQEYGVNWIVMADTEGNEFCVCDHGWQRQQQ